MKSHAVSRVRVENGNVELNGAAKRGRGMDAWMFAYNFVKHPWMLGSVIPSSPFLVRKVLGRVDWPRVERVIEYGPGVGTFTREILRRLGKDGSLTVFETNRDFVQWLGRIDDPRLRVVHGSAEEARTVLAGTKVDYAISGIPFKHFPGRMRRAIVEMTHDVLRPGGHFLVYQFSRSVRPILESTFGPVEEDFEPLNLMPARIYSCCRKG